MNSRGLVNRLRRMERRLTPSIQPPNVVVRFIGPDGEMTSTLTFVDGRREWWYALGHEPGMRTERAESMGQRQMSAGECR